MQLVLLKSVFDMFMTLPVECTIPFWRYFWMIKNVQIFDYGCNFCWVKGGWGKKGTSALLKKKSFGCFPLFWGKGGNFWYDFYLSHIFFFFKSLKGCWLGAGGIGRVRKMNA